MRNSVLFLFTIVILLTGCGESSEQHDQEIAESTDVETTNGKVEGEYGEKSEDVTKDKKIISSQATYIGLMDPHTIEVIINNEPLAIQINEEQMKKLEPLQTNEQITIEYYYNEETSQNILENIELNP
ncbi:MAG: hypothetical protein ACQEWV_21390 [Bacillota bacterium]